MWAAQVWNPHFNMNKMYIRVSAKNDAKQARVFNVAVSDCWNEWDVEHMAKRQAPSYCTVEVHNGWKRKRGTPRGLLEVLKDLSNLHFYRYYDVEVVDEKFSTLAVFYEKPFEVNYAGYIGATFFSNMNEKIITNELDALLDVVPFTLRMAKSGCYYCWKQLDMRMIDGRWHLGEVSYERKTIRMKEELQ